MLDTAVSCEVLVCCCSCCCCVSPCRWRSCQTWGGRLVAVMNFLLIPRKYFPSIFTKRRAKSKEDPNDGNREREVNWPTTRHGVLCSKGYTIILGNEWYGTVRTSALTSFTRYAQRSPLFLVRLVILLFALVFPCIMSSSSARSTLFCRPRRRQQGRLFGFIIIVLLVVFGTTTVARRRWMIVMQQAHSIPSSSSTTGAAPEIGISSSREKKRSDSADRWYTMYDNFSRMMLLWKQWVTSTSSSTALRLTSKNPNAPDKDDILPGVTVTRTMIHFPKHGNLTLDVDNDAIICSHRDVYGDNDCHWNWNATLGGTITALFDQPIQHGDYIEGHVKVCLYGCV